MNSEPANSHGVPDHERLSASHASVFLKLGITSSHKRPADELAERLACKDGTSWLSTALDKGALRGVGSAKAMLLEGHAALDQLDIVKRQSKVMVNEGAHHDRWLAGIAGYFFAIAAGLVHYNRHIGSRSLQEVSDALLELASVAPEPWADFLTRAAAKAQELEAQPRR